MNVVLDCIKKDCMAVAIVGHQSPDGDCIGACFALAMALRSLNKTVYVLLDDYSDRYHVIPGAEFLYKGEQNALLLDAIIVLDCASLDMLNIDAELWNKTKLKINVDHHISNTNFADLNYVKQASSASEMVFQMIQALPVSMTKEIATALYAGIIYDTGGFKHPSTEIPTHLAAAALLEWDINFSEIHAEILSKRSLTDAKVFSVALDTLQMVEGYPIAYTLIKESDFERVGSASKSTEGIIDFIFNLYGVEVAAVFAEKKGVLRTSLRSKGNLNVAEVALAFDGGGHKNAAGCSLKGDIDVAVESMLRKLKEMFA